MLRWPEILTNVDGRDLNFFDFPPFGRLEVKFSIKNRAKHFKKWPEIRGPQHSYKLPDILLHGAVTHDSTM